MYLLIPLSVVKNCNANAFTFHNVSINSRSRWRSRFYGRIRFTFHNVSINSNKFYIESDAHVYLHSIMYLLIQKREKNWFFSLVFTFHNVSINSPGSSSRINRSSYLHSIMYLLIRLIHADLHTSNINLHSIMYLLIPQAGHAGTIEKTAFTFHNVSINSRPPTTIISSIVFLLFLSTSFYSPHLISIFLL